MIKVLVVDDHAAVRAGLQAVLKLEPGFVPAGEARTAGEALEVAEFTKPNVALVDYHLPDEDGLALCMKLKAAQPSCHVLIYSAYAGAGLAVPALVAGADGLVDKSALGWELFDAIRAVARGNRAFPEISPEHLSSAARRLSTDELPVLGMLLDRTAHSDIASTLGIEPHHLDLRVQAMVRRLRVETAAS
jgi:DNA-binding NarL/FixJ family response regulator